MAQATYLEAIRRGLCRGVAFGFLLVACSSLNAQKIAEVDLTQAVPAVAEQPVLTKECEGNPGGFSHSDGSIVSDSGRRKLELNVISLSPLSPALGSAVDARITLKNADKVDIEIPWATDPNTARRPLAAAQYEYESAWFWIKLKDESGKEKLLKSLSTPLYGSVGQPQSTLKLAPGQWVTLHIKFRLLFEDESALLDFAPGPAEVKIEWRQGNFTWERKGCNITTGYSSYDTFYEQRMDPVKVVIASKEDEAQGNTQSKK